jgi:GNAT superfamily N-acetyltransferase/hypoxanthine-guanine phosphoribosyltransferase
MHTIHLTEEQVLSYLRDLAERLRKLPSGPPQLWVALGGSGSVLAKRLDLAAPDLSVAAEALIVAYDRSTGSVSYPRNQDPATLRGKRAIVVDGTVNSGSTLLRTLRELESHKPASLISYALAVRRGAAIIPNFFGFLIGDHDRVHFLAREFENNRLLAFGTCRKLAEGDLSRPMIKCGKSFIDKIAWEDRWYEIVTDPPRQVYLHEQGDRICGFISFRLQDNGSLLIEEIAVDQEFRGRGIGGCLIRWAEHWGRHANCSRVELWALEDRVQWYRDRGYEGVEGSSPLRLPTATFVKLRKRILYNLQNDDLLGIAA